MTSQTDARLCVITLGYDVLNRPTTKSSSGAGCGTQVSTTYTYDVGTNGKGGRTSMNDASGSTSWLYDSRGRVWKETKVISSSSFVTEWTYNLADLPVTMKYPDGEIVTTTYDNNMLSKTVIGTATYVSNMNYDSAGRLTSRVLGNGLTQTYTYYPWNQQGGRLQTLITGTLQNLSHQYDAVGNITQIANSAAGETSVYGYDTLDRLTSWQLNQNPVESYSYDSAGNLDVKNGLDLNYNDASHKHAVTHIGSTQKYWYDQNGNQVTRVVGADTFTLIYDAENRLVEVKKNSVTIATFTFDGDGKRVKSVINGETILFVGAHFEQKGGQATKYYFAGATRIAMRKYTIPQNMTVEYMVGDHLGSTSITTDTAGVKISEMRYKAWGETRYTWTNAPGNTSPTYELPKYQYTGQYSYTAEFGLHFYNARWYDSLTGRFAQADTMIPQSQGTQAYDRYAFVNNNPIRYTDPTGHKNCEEDGYNCDDEGLPTTEQQEIQALIDNGEYEAAIALANELYDIELDITSIVIASPPSNPIARGEVLPSGQVYIAPSTVTNTAALLIETLYHESVHVEQLFNKRYYVDPENGPYEGLNMNEVEAYDRTIAHYRELDLPLSSLLSMLRDRKKYYDNLSPSSQQEVNAGNYTLPLPYVPVPSQ
jgi:RHS repeat-associated protein